jgi:hypothetical protein
MKNLKIFKLTILLLLFSCTDTSTKKEYRDIASEPLLLTHSCSKSIKTLLDADYNKKLVRALIDKKLVTKKTNYMKIKAPGDSWFRKVRKAWIQRIKNLNDNKYPTYYMYDDEESVAHAIAYGKLFTKKISGEFDDEGEELAIKTVDDWIMHFTNYEKELANLIEERVSIAFNRDILKRNKPTTDRMEVDLSYRIDGKKVSENIVFYEEDKNYQYYIKQLNEKLTSLDGGLFDWWFSEGKIKSRIIKQAIMRDQLTFVHRELEYFYQNSPKLSFEVKNAMKKKIDELSEIIEDSAFKPSRYGLFKVDFKKWNSEIRQLPKTVKSNKKVTDAKKVYNDILDDEDKERVKYFTDGISKRLRGTAAGSILALFATGTTFKDKVINLIWSREKAITECVEDSDDDYDYFECIFDFVHKNYPQVITAQPGNQKIDLFAYEKVPSSIRKSYTKDLERAKRLWAFKKYLRQKKLDSRNAFKDEVKSYYDSIIIAEEDFNKCAKILNDDFRACLYEYLSKEFPELFKRESKSGFDIYDYSQVPEEYRKEYREKVEEILSQKATYEDLYENFTKDAEKLR